MAGKPTRVAALVLALVFFATSVAFSGAVLWQIFGKKDDSQNSNTSEQAQDKPKEGKLEGTKLQNFTPVATVTDLKSEDIQTGTGEEVKPGATVTAHYTGAVAKDGTIFQSSHDQPGDQPIEFSLSGVIPGWTNGVPGMKVGGKRRLLIPAAQAYGAQEKPGIPANSDLVFDIELTAVKNP